MEILGQYQKGNLEITVVKTDKPILPAKPGIRIENINVKKLSFWSKLKSKVKHLF